MNDDETIRSSLDAIDPEAMKRFGMWMVKGADAERVEIFEAITDGDELGGSALASLCDMELSSAVEEVRGEKETFKDWFSTADITEYCEKCGGGKYDARYFIGALVDMADAGLVAMRSEPLRYKGGYIGTSTAFRVHWPNLLDFWDSTLDRLFRPDGHVYLLGGGGFYKIGRARNVDTRVKQLSIQLPWPVELEHVFPCAGYVEAEKALHQMFSEYRSNGEWFMLPERAVEYVKGIKRMRGSYIEPLESLPSGSDSLIPEQTIPQVREPKSGETHQYKQYVVEEGFAMQELESGQTLRYTFANTAWEAENLFWNQDSEGMSHRESFAPTLAVRVTDTYIDYKIAGDPRHVLPWNEWEWRKETEAGPYD